MDTRARLVNSLVSATLATDEQSYLRAEILVDTLTRELSDREYAAACEEAARRVAYIERGE